MRLIDADWLEDLLLMHEQNARSMEKSGRKSSFTYADGIRTGYADVGLCPTVDAVPVRHGKWIRHDEVKNIYGGTYIECSECGEKYVVQYVEDEKFCRNCGARMDGGE